MDIIWVAKCKCCNKEFDKFKTPSGRFVNKDGIAVTNTCVECKTKLSEEKKLVRLDKKKTVVKNLPPLGLITLSKCKSCEQMKTKINAKYNPKGNSFIYCDETGSSWSGKNCPDCKKKRNRSYQKTRPPRPKKEHKEKKCITCDKEFLAQTSLQKFCSPRCARKLRNKKRKSKRNLQKVIHNKECATCNVAFQTTSKSKKYCQTKCIKNKSKKVKQLITKNCLHCNKEFSTKYKNKLYCKAGHSRSSIESRRKRKKKDRYYSQYKNPLSRKFKKEIISIYENRPEGYDVDHIIPRNHPDVCGLHVPWNLQYLPKEENRIKSNNWELKIIHYGTQ